MTLGEYNVIQMLWPSVLRLTRIPGGNVEHSLPRFAR